MEVTPQTRTGKGWRTAVNKTTPSLNLPGKYRNRGGPLRTLWRQEVVLRPNRKKGLEKSSWESVHVPMFIET